MTLICEKTKYIDFSIALIDCVKNLDLELCTWIDKKNNYYDFVTLFNKSYFLNREYLNSNKDYFYIEDGSIGISNNKGNKLLFLVKLL